MKSCSSQRKDIALLAAGHLSGVQEKALRGHLADCEGCRSYFEEMNGLAQRLGGLDAGANVRASEDFHLGTLRRIQPERRESFAGWWPALAAAAAVAGAMIVLHGPSRTTEANPATHETALNTTDGRMAPTLGNYQTAAGESLDKLNAMLDSEGARSSAPGPVYTAGRFNPQGTD